MKIYIVEYIISKFNIINIKKNKINSLINNVFFFGFFIFILI